MKRRIAKYFIVLAIVGICSHASIANAQPCTYAALNLSSSDIYSASSAFYAMIALFAGAVGEDPSFYEYYAYYYMSTDSNYAYIAFQLSANCYNSNPGNITSYGYYAAMYRSYYRGYAALYLGYVYSGYNDYIGPSITSIYQGDVYSSSAAFWLGLASDGGEG